LSDCPQTGTNKAVDERGQTCALELNLIFSIVLGEHDECRPKVIEEVGRVKVAATDALERDAIGPKLVGEIAGPEYFRTKAAAGGIDVEFSSENTSI